MASISLTLPVSGTQITAGLHATNYGTIQTAINGGLDNNNFAAGKIFDVAKLMQNAAVDGDGVAWDNTNSKWVPTSTLPAAARNPAGLVKLWDSVDAGVTLPAASVTTPTLPQTFKHLRARICGQTNSGNAIDTLLMRVNGVSTASYYHQRGSFNGTTSSAGTSAGATSTTIGSLPGVATGSMGICDLRIPNYALAATGLTTWLSDVFLANINTNTVREVYGGYIFAGPVTTLTFLPSAGSFIAAGFRISIYGEA